MASTTTIERKPIAGALSGFALGLGLALLLVGRKVIAFGTLPVVVLPIAFLVLGIAWGLFGPPKRAKQVSAAPSPSPTEPPS